MKKNYLYYSDQLFLFIILFYLFFIYFNINFDFILIFNLLIFPINYILFNYNMSNSGE